MNIKCIKVGYLRCNCYLIEKQDEYLLIDPGDDLEKIEELIKDKNIKGILTTHSHFDHIASLDDLVENYNYKSYDLNNLKEGINTIGNFSFEVIKTFGHTMDSICFYFSDEKIIFTGDFLFKGTIGRCDLIESDYKEMLKSIEKIKKYPDDITIYPGHGLKTNLGLEKKNNPYF